MTPVVRSRGWLYVLLVCLAIAVAAFPFARPIVDAYAAHRVSVHKRVHRAVKRPATAAAPDEAVPTPVLVELFTSEGCSSCPTADLLLARLQSEQPVPSADVLALEEHVDYWDSPEWHDRFASNQFNVRQNAYNDRLLLHSEYTPQMIVDGTKELEGTDVVRAFHTIAQAASTPKLPLRLSPVVFDGDRVAGGVSLAGSAKAVRGAYVYAALVESPVATHVLGGENGGQTLNHVSVVREMRQIGSVTRARRTPLKFSLKVPDDAMSAALRVVVFVQRAGQGAVLGAVEASPAVHATPAITTALVRMDGRTGGQ